ncbi:MAG: hypothetical protein NT090_05445 [Acidobacteria bacterium]|nr:hypothetical protein [Acidobacteriota bacterium]
MVAGGRCLGEITEAATGVCLAAGSRTSEMVRGPAEVETRRPWFWSPPVESFADIPYTWMERSNFRRFAVESEIRLMDPGCARQTVSAVAGPQSG